MNYDEIRVRKQQMGNTIPTKQISDRDKKLGKVAAKFTAINEAIEAPNFEKQTEQSPYYQHSKQQSPEKETIKEIVARLFDTVLDPALEAMIEKVVEAKLEEIIPDIVETCTQEAVSRIMKARR